MLLRTAAGLGIPRRISVLLLVLVLPLAVGVVAAQILSFMRGGEQVSRDARVHLSRLHENVLFLEHVTGHVIQMGRLTPDLEKKLVKLRPQAMLEVGEIERELEGAATADRVTRGWARYAASLDARLAGIPRGTPHHASMPMGGPPAQPNPVFESFVELIDEESTALGTRAERVSRNADLAAVLIVVVAALGLALFVHRHERARRRAAVAAVERNALRESEGRFRALVQNANDVVTVVDRDGTIVYESDAVERVLGYDVERRLGTNFLSYAVNGDAEGLRAQLTQVAGAAGSSGTAEFSARTSAGETRSFEARLTNLSDDPRIAGIVITHRDVSERKALEEQLRQAQKMEAIGQLAGGVAHDFNNLLMAISGYADQAVGHVKSDPDRASRELSEIRKAAMRAGDLTRQLLAFGRRQMLRPHLVDLNEAVTSVDSLLRRLLGTDIEIVSELEPRLPLVKADPAQLEQVVVNLAVNARDAMQNGGRLVLRTRVLELDAADAALAELEPGRYVALEVVDTGVGMDEETAARAIEPFYTTKPVGKGTGLGLSMVYGSIRQSGGGLRIESSPGDGTTIRIIFPVAAEAADLPESNGSGPESGDGASRRPRVLLVEDEEAVANLVRELLEDDGYDVAPGRHPHEALEIAAGSPPFELLITDLVMPELNGRQLAETLRRRQPDLDVLFMSGYAGTAVIERGLLEPGTPFLQKPFRLPDLLRTVRGLIDGHQAAA